MISGLDHRRNTVVVEAQKACGGSVDREQQFLCQRRSSIEVEAQQRSWRPLIAWVANRDPRIIMVIMAAA
jgi:hypothetical protein